MTDAMLDAGQPLPGMPEPQQMLPAATDPRIPADLEGFTTHFGIPVCSLGEDGDLMALGHHQPKQALAAMNAYAKTLGFMDLLDGGTHDSDGWRKALERIKPCWAVPLRACEEHIAKNEPVAGCAECGWVSAAAWCVDYSATEETAGAFPATVWTV